MYLFLTMYIYIYIIHAGEKGISAENINRKNGISILQMHTMLSLISTYSTYILLWPICTNEHADEFFSYHVFFS